MSVTLSKNNFFTVDLGTAIHNLTTASLKVAFTDTAPTAGGTHVYADIASPLATTNIVGGASSLIIPSTTYTQSGGTATLSAGTLTLTSQTGNFGAFRYVVVYDDSSASKNVIGWYDYGSEVTLNSGDTFTVGFDQSNGVITIA